MMKKQQAAMNAAEALAARTKDNENMEEPQPSPPTRKSSVLPAKTAAKQASAQKITTRSKKGQNLAVVCATETLAAYRQELIRKACT